MSQNQHQSNSHIPIDIHGILTCISDALIIYVDHDVLYSNAEGLLLLEQTSYLILEELQFESSEFCIHHFNIKIPDRDELLVAHCLPTHWLDKPACVAIIRTDSKNDKLIESPIKATTKSRKRLDLLFQVAGDGYWDWFIPTAYVYFSPSWKTMLGYDGNEIQPSFNCWISLIHPDDLGRFLVSWAKYMDNEQQQFSVEYRMLKKDKQYLWVEAYGIKDLDANDEIERLVGFHRDISVRKNREAKIKIYHDNLEQIIYHRTQQLEAANQKLAKLSMQDPLTQLQNRRSFDENLKVQLRSTHRNKLPLCLLLLDIDYFKVFNDEFGHQQGDRCLIAVAEVLRQSISRPIDTAARFGGEEFVIILPETDINGGVLIAQKIQQGILNLKGQPINPKSLIPLSLSIGIATNKLVADITEDQIIEFADKAMYKAKDNGRNQICYFESEQDFVYIENTLRKKLMPHIN